MLFQRDLELPRAFRPRVRAASEPCVHAVDRVARADLGGQDVDAGLDGRED